MLTLFHEVRHAVRMMLRSPGLTAVAALSLALGIGVNSAMFSLHDALMLRPLPIPDPNAVLAVTADSPDEPSAGRMSYPNYRDLRAQTRTFDGLVAFQQTVQTLATSRDAPRDVRLGLLVSDNFFDRLRVQPTLGRGFTSSEGEVPDRAAVVILGYDFWKGTLAADPAIVGRVLLINGVDFTVVGVAPERFTGMDTFFKPDFYVPIMMARRLTQNALQRGGGTAGDPIEDREARTVAVRGRLKPGESQRTSQAEMTAIWNRLVQQYPVANRDRTMAVRSELRNRIRNDPGNAATIAMMTTLAALLLVIACANVANLLLGRARGRAREMAIRLAMGVSRARLLRQLLIESFVLATIGCLIGLWVAYGGIQFLAWNIRAALQSDLRLEFSPQLDLRVLWFSLAATIASAIIFGLSPAWQSLKTDLIPALKNAEPGRLTRHRTIGRNVLVVAQVALSMVLLVGAAMLLGGFGSRLDVNPGFRTDHLLTMRTDTVFGRYTPAQTHDFYRELVERSRVLPGVASVSLASAVPFDGNFRFEPVRPDGFQLPRGNENISVMSAIVDERYFDTIRIPLVRGRGFSAFDGATAPRVAIVNESLANAYWPGQDPLGKRIQLRDSKGPSLEVVGVAKNSKYFNLAEGQTPFLYRPFAQDEQTQMTLLVETVSADPVSMAAALRQVVRSIDVSQPTFDVRSLQRLFEQRGLGPPLMVMRVLSAISVLGLCLALVGLYSLVAYSVSRRTREIGLRMAMGAAQSQVLGMVLRQGLTLAMVGVLVGGVVSVFAGRAIASVLVGLATPNPLAYAAVPAMLIGMTLAASYLPARRAAAVDPLRALRDE